MIKFFRKIRQKLLTENRFNKYLLYAIGEIALVVIGILIALQFNNWNENRKEKIIELELLKKLKEENYLNITSIEDQVELRKQVPNYFYSFSRLLEKGNLEANTKLVQESLGNILQSSAYTFIQSSLKNYITKYNAENATLTKELAKLEFIQNDLQLSSTKGLDLKFDYVFETLENDIDFNSLNIRSYKTLNSLKFKNRIILLTEVEAEISDMFLNTYTQMKKIDSLITKKLQP